MEKILFCLAILALLLYIIRILKKILKKLCLLISLITPKPNQAVKLNIVVGKISNK